MKELYAFISGLILLCTYQAQAQSSYPCPYVRSHTPSGHEFKMLSSPENVAREGEYDVHFYFLDLDIEKTSSYISGNVMVQASSLVSALDTFSLDLDSAHFIVDSVYSALDLGTYLSAQYTQSGNGLAVILPFSAGMNQTVQTRVWYHGTAATSTGGYPNGNAFFMGNTQVFSASPPYNSASWWPGKQDLNDKADSSWFFITTDTSNTAISNGLLTNIVRVDSNKKRCEWKSHHAIDFYLISFVVGAYARTTQYLHPPGRMDSMIVEYYNLSPSYTLDVLDKYDSLFGLYPFYDEKFGIASVYLGGGMENQTIVSLGIAGTVIEHETMHQWFGDNVTCGTYRDLFLNEGFARWAESLYPELASSNPDSTRISICNQYENGSALYGKGGLGYPLSSIYNYNVDTVDILKLYADTGRGMNYEKAAMMINSLRFEINNDSLFFQGLHNYQTAFAGRTAVANDLIDVMENTTGMDFTDFFNQWLFGYGFPTFNINWNQQNGLLAISIAEVASDSTETPLFKTSLQVTIQRINNLTMTEGDTTIRLFVPQSVTGLTIPCSDSVTGFWVDPYQWILNGTGTVTNDTSLPFNTGVQTLAAVSEFKVYPNPASDYLYIQYTGSDTGPINAALYNTLGQIVLSENISLNEPIDLRKLTSGLYMLELNQSSSYKISVDR
jgi:aminopeptidase N